jgi:hypothetical protein
MPLLLYYFITPKTHKQCICIKSFYTQQHRYVSLKPYTLAGFEPGSSFLRLMRWSLCHAGDFLEDLNYDPFLHEIAVF